MLVAVGSIASPAWAQLSPVAEALRQRVDESRYLSDASAAAPEQAGVPEFYERRGFRPAWTEPARIDALRAALESLRDDGLRPEDYGVAHLIAARASLSRSRTPATASAEADLDWRFSRAYLLALSHLYWGKVDPKALDPRWNFQQRALDRERALRAVIEAVDQGLIAGVFERARPTHPIYTALRQGLADLRAIERAGGWPRIAPGDTLDPGASDPRVSVLRERLLASGHLAPPFAPPPATGTAASAADRAASPVRLGPDPEWYDPALEAAVRRFQAEQYLKPDGRVGKETLAALNVSVAQRIGQMRVNLERARWQLHEIRDAFVLVDVAGFKIGYFEGARPVWSSRVQVGRTYRSTPIFQSEITYVTFNPTWTVPPTILRNDVLPKVRQDPGYLAKNHLRVLASDGRTLDPSAVDWSRPGAVTLRQDAGPSNALGRAVIRFPNEYLVYLHDTPSQALFEREQRAFSSGCIRVERALELVERLLADPERWSREAIDQVVAAGETQTVNLSKPVPILLVYWTVDVLADGRIAFKPDIYGRDPPILAALDMPALEAPGGVQGLIDSQAATEAPD